MENIYSCLSSYRCKYIACNYSMGHLINDLSIQNPLEIRQTLTITILWRYNKRLLYLCNCLFLPFLSLLLFNQEKGYYLVVQWIKWIFLKNNIIPNIIYCQYGLYNNSSIYCRRIWNFIRGKIIYCRRKGDFQKRNWKTHSLIFISIWTIILLILQVLFLKSFQKSYYINRNMHLGWVTSRHCVSLVEFKSLAWIMHLQHFWQVVSFVMEELFHLSVT